MWSQCLLLLKQGPEYTVSGVTFFKKILPFQMDDLWQIGNRNVLHTATMNVVPLGANDTNDGSK